MLASRIISAAGIKLSVNRELETAAVCIDRDAGTYHIMVGPFFDSLPTQLRETVLLHELGHIVRGDCLIMGSTSIDQRRWNVAADTLINAGLNRNHVEMLQGILLDQLGIGEFVHIPNARVVYDLLEQQESQSSQSPLSGDVRAADASDSRAREIHDDVVTRVKIAISELSPAERAEIEAIISALPKVQLRELSRVEVPEVPYYLGDILRRVRRYESNSGELVRVRSYTRPGRVEGLRGVTRYPRLRIAVVIDLSGSMTEYYPIVLGIAQYLARKHNITLIGHDTQARIMTLTQEDISQFGGGTSWDEAISLLETVKPDITIWFTDGEFENGSVTAIPFRRPLMMINPASDKVLLERL
jgi:hypothetical protein